MVHIVNRQIPHICLHLYCTKSEHGLLDTGNLVINGLYLLQTQIGDSSVKQALLRDLDEALVGDDEDTEMPADPTGSENEQAQQTTANQAAKKEPHAKIRLQRGR